MNIEYIGVKNANIEGRYNDMYYFIDKIVSLEQRFINETHIGNIIYNNTNEFDDISVIPHENGIEFQIDNLNSDIDNNNTTASLIVKDQSVYFVLTKADWEHNKNTDLQSEITKNVKKKDEIISQLGMPLETDKISEYEKGTGLVKLGQTMRENRQRKAYENVMIKAMNTLKQALLLFRTNENYKNLKSNQEKLKQQAEAKEEYIQKIKSIPDEQIDVIFQFSEGKIDQKTAIEMMKQNEEKRKMEEQGMVSEQQQELQNQMNVLYQLASGDIDSATAEDMVNKNERHEKTTLDNNSHSDWL